MDHDFSRLIDDALREFWQRNPVTATFAGESQYNARLPRADAATEAQECRAIELLAARRAAISIPDHASARIDARHLDAYCALAGTEFARRARYRNPAWYTGEAAFGIIALLLAAAGTQAAHHVRARLRAIPAFLDDGIARLGGEPIPSAWAHRAQTELGALKRLVREALPLHPAGSGIDAQDAGAVSDACDRFGALISQAADADAACGEREFALILQRVHGLGETPAALERRASAAFAAVLDALETQARQLDPSLSWREHMERLAHIGPDGGDIVGTYRHWHERALRDACEFMTPERDFSLAFEPLPAWARPVAADLYFLFYRSPAIRNAGTGSTYWVAPPHGSAAEIRRLHNTAAVKLVHAVHHGSIGHHTQNARARTAGSRFAQIAGVDGAGAIALLAAGTMVEGWACYAEDLMAEVPGFYTAAERLQLTYFELRNIASCLADIRFHTGTYTLDKMRAFYRDDVAFAAARVGPETTRNSMYPGSRVMYWCGSQQIKDLRARSALATKTFHDTLLSFGATPIAWIAEELAR